MFIPGVKCPFFQGTLSILLCSHLVVSSNVFLKYSGCFPILSDACWLTNVLRIWLTDRLPNWMTEWLTDFLPDWSTDRLSVWLWLTDWLTDQKIDWLIFWMYLYDCLSNWQSAWLIEWLTYWLTAKSHRLNCNAVSQKCVLIGFFHSKKCPWSSAKLRPWACPFLCPNWFCRVPIEEMVVANYICVPSACQFLLLLVSTPEGQRKVWEWWNFFHDSKSFLNYPINVHRRCKMPLSSREI